MRQREQREAGDREGVGGVGGVGFITFVSDTVVLTTGAGGVGFGVGSTGFTVGFGTSFFTCCTLGAFGGGVTGFSTILTSFTSFGFGGLGLGGSFGFGRGGFGNSC